MTQTLWRRNPHEACPSIRGGPPHIPWPGLHRGRVGGGVARSQQSPLQGNSPNDRMLRGPDCDRPKRVCAAAFPATPSPPLPRIEGSQKAFFRHGGIYRSDVVSRPKPRKPGGGVPPPVGRPPSPSPRTRRKDRALPIVHDEFRPVIPRSGYLRLSAFICGPYGFSNSANALQSSQAAEIVAPREEFGV
jgi:hypothetical protein